MLTTQPDSSEYGSYYEPYIAEFRDENILTILKTQRDSAQELFLTIPEDRSFHRYAPGKWSIKELTGHLIDTERVFVYRAFRFSRNDDTPLHGYDHDAYVAVANYDARPFADIVAEFVAGRHATLAFLSGLSDEMLLRRGMANNNSFTVRALAWIIAGHTEHHLSILKDKYL
jgi:hypothetical protein